MATVDSENFGALDWEPPLVTAAASGSVASVRDLVDSGMDVNVVDSATGRTALMAASEKNHVAVVEELVHCGAQLDAQHRETGVTALYVAVQSGHTPTVKCLLRVGASANTVCTNGATPLYAAAARGDLHIASILLRKPADANDATSSSSDSVKDMRVDTSDESADTTNNSDGEGVFGGVSDREDGLRDNPGSANEQVLVEGDAGDAGDGGDDGIGGGADVDAALLAACRLADGPAVSFIVEVLKAGVNGSANSPTTPLIEAVRGGSSDTVARLVGAKATVSLADDEGRTCLTVAQERGFGDVFAECCFSDVAPVINGRSRERAASLYLASERGDVKLVNLCLNAQLSGSPHECVSDSTLIKSMWIAVSNGHSRCLPPLLSFWTARETVVLAREKGAPTSHATRVSQGRLEEVVCLAAHKGDMKCLHVLLDSNPSLALATETSSSLTAVDYAGQGGHESAISLLQKLARRGRVEVVAARERLLAVPVAGGVSLSVRKRLVDNDAASVSRRVALASFARTGGGLNRNVAFVGPPARVNYVGGDGADRPADMSAADTESATGGAIRPLPSPGSTESEKAANVSQAEDSSSSDREDLRPLARGGSGKGVSERNAKRRSDDESSDESTADNKSELRRYAITGAAKMEELMSRLKGNGRSFVFSHILPTSKLGSGTFGDVMGGVYRGRKVAYKLEERRRAAGADYNDVNRLGDFANEAAVLSLVAEPTHPNVVTFLGVAVAPEFGVALVTEQVNGSDIKAHLSKHAGTGLPVVHALYVAAGVAAGLSFLHDIGIVHADLKPGNILLEPAEGGDREPRSLAKPRIIDLGGGAAYWGGVTSYTPLYAAPEQLAYRYGNASEVPLLAEQSSDVFALACVAVELLTGVRPSKRRWSTDPILVFEGEESIEHALLRILPPEVLITSGGGLIDMLLRCWATEMANRPSSHEVAEVLVGLLVEVDKDAAAVLKADVRRAPRCRNARLLRAVVARDVAGVEDLVARGERGDSTNRWGRTALHAAAALDNAAILELLLKAKSPPYLVSDAWGYTPLDVAVEQFSRYSGACETLPLLQDHAGRYPERVRESRARQRGNLSAANSLPIHHAATVGDIGMAQLLINNGSDVNVADRAGDTALHLALRLGNVDFAQLVLEAGANVNAVNAFGRTPLMDACARGSGVDLVLSVGANIDYATINGESAVYIAAVSGEVATLQALLKAGANPDGVSAQATKDRASVSGSFPLIAACMGGHVECARVLVNEGANVNVTDSGGCPVLLIAIETEGLSSLAGELLEAGADARYRHPESGRSAFHYAAASGLHLVLQHIVDAGGELDAVDAKGASSLLVATSHGQLSVVEGLLALGADVNLADNSGTTPVACVEGMLSSAKVTVETRSTELERVRDALRAGGGRINGVTSSGDTSVAAAVKAGDVARVQACLEARAELDSRRDVVSLPGGTVPLSVAQVGRAAWVSVAFDQVKCLQAILSCTIEFPADGPLSLAVLVCLAAHKGSVAAVEALLDYDRDCALAVETTSGKTAAEYALDAGHGDVLRLLVSHGATHPTEANDDLASEVPITELPTMTGYASTAEASRMAATRPRIVSDPSWTLSLAGAPSDSYPTVAFDRVVLVETVTDSDGTSETVPTERVAVREAAASQQQLSLSMLDDLSKRPKVVLTHTLPTITIGTGAFGDVVCALLVDRLVAMKVAKSDDTSSGFNVAAEARLLAVLEEPTHPNCVGFVGVGMAPNLGFAIVTEFGSGGDLRCHLQRSKLGVVAGLELLAGLADGLNYLHCAGIAHGDIKPANVVLDNSGDGLCGKWIDLGGSCAYWRGRTAYTRRYASPEQLRMKLTEAGSDVFSFACVILEVVTLKKPDSRKTADMPPVFCNRHGVAFEDHVDAYANLASNVRTWLPDELRDCDAFVELLANCWHQDVYSRPRTTEVFELLMRVLGILDPTRETKLQNALNSCASRQEVGHTELMTAVQYCEVERVREIVNLGADVNAQNRWGYTALHIAAAVSRIEVVESLLSCHPVLLRDAFDFTAYDVALSQRSGDTEDTLKLLRSYYMTHGALNSASLNSAPTLHESVRDKDIGVVRLLLESGVDINAVNDAGESALHVAVGVGAVKIGVFLAERGAEVDVADSQGETPLFKASTVGMRKMVALLVSHGANVCISNRLGWTPLAAGAHGGHDAVIQLILSNGAPVDASTPGGHTALMCAAQNGHTTALQSLVCAGCEVNAATRDGWTALMFAAHNRHPYAVAALLAAGAVPSVATPTNWTALLSACVSGDLSSVSLLTTAISGGGHRIETISRGTWVAASSLRREGRIEKAAIGVRDGQTWTWRSGRTALMCACENGRVTVIMALLEAKVDINRINESGETALILASRRGNGEAVSVLISAGADVDVRVLDGTTALFYACHEGHADVAVTLLHAGASTFAAPRDPRQGLLSWSPGQTLLDVARENEHEETVAILEEVM